MFLYVYNVYIKPSDESFNNICEIYIKRLYKKFCILEWDSGSNLTSPY